MRQQVSLLSIHGLEQSNMEISTHDQGLTYNNAAKHFPQSVETLKGHMVKSSQGVRSTKKISNKTHDNQIEKSQKTFHKQQKSDTEEILPQQKTKEIHIWYQPISKLYTDDCGRFPIRSRSGND